MKYHQNLKKALEPNVAVFHKKKVYMITFFTEKIPMIQNIYISKIIKLNNYTVQTVFSQRFILPKFILFKRRSIHYCRTDTTAPVQSPSSL
jgi:hypothetical protein